MFPHFAHDGAQPLADQGMSASPGAAVGKAYFTSRLRWQRPRTAMPVIPCDRETNPDDLHGNGCSTGS